MKTINTLADRHARRTAARFALLVLAVMPLAMVGCNQTKPPSGARQDPFPGDQYPKVAVEPQLQQWVGVDYDRVRVTAPTPDSPLKVDVPVRSLADLEMFTQYQFTWFDSQGRILGSSGWKSVTLEPRLQVIMSSNATTSKAEDWRLEIRSAR